MKQWEYNLVKIADLVPTDLLKRFDSLGEQGWEAATSFRGANGSDYVLMKRPKARE